MQSVDMVAILSVFQFLFFGVMTGKARAKSGLKAPIMTGDEAFERMYRVQMNTLEVIILFLPSLLLASKYWPSTLISVLGCIYLVGRFLYWRAYVTEPSKRGLGFMLSLVPIVILMVLTLGGIVWSWFNV